MWETRDREDKEEVTRYVGIEFSSPIGWHVE